MFFSLAYFLNQLVSNLRYKTSFPKNPNHEFLQGQQCLIVRYVSAARLYNFYYVTKPWLQSVHDEIEMVCMSIRFCLFQIVMLMLQKIRKN